MKFCKIEPKTNPSNCGECKYISARPEYDVVVKGRCGITGEEFLIDYSSRREVCPYNYNQFCEKCMEIFSHQNYLYCPYCGEKLIDAKMMEEMAESNDYRAAKRCVRRRAERNGDR